MSRYRGHKVCQLSLLAAAAPKFTSSDDFPYGMTKEAVNKLIQLNYKDRPQMLAHFGNMFFASQVSPNFRAWFHMLGLGASSHATAASAVALRNEDLRPDLSAIHVPTSILHGALDQVCPFSLALKMQAAIPHAELFRFEKSGHAIFYDELEEFND